MILQNDHWFCTFCGKPVEGIARDARPVAGFEATSGKPTERVVTVDGREVHRCCGPVDARRSDAFASQ